jgi:superfamily II DNA or RNA helicase
LFAYITENAARRGNRVMIVVHRKELLQQASRKLFEIGVGHGVIAPKFPMTHDNVQVASVDSLNRRLEKISPPDLIIQDEAHHLTKSNKWGRMRAAFPNAKLLGVTATPLRRDGIGLGKETGGYFDTLVMGPSPQELIDLGFLSQVEIYRPPIPADASGLHQRYGDFIREEMEMLLDKPTITGCAVEHYKRICPDVPAIAFCASLNHAQHVANQFSASGIPSMMIDGTMNDADRLYRIDGLSNGKFKVLTSVELVNEGVDIPVVTAAILLRFTTSLNIHIQQCGRAMRPHPDKSMSYILDHVGNTFRHGFPDDDRIWTLDGEYKTDSPADEPMERLVQCEKCYLVFKRAAGRCPACGWVPGLSPREIEEVQGELERVQEADRERAKRAERREVGMAQSLEELQELGRKRGYRPGWAYNIWQARQRKRGVYA